MARVVDLGTVIDVLRGKLEFRSGEEGRELAVLEAPTAPCHRRHRAKKALGGIDVGPLVAAVENSTVTTGEQVPAKDVLAALPSLPVIREDRRSPRREDRGQRCRRSGAGARALYLARRSTRTSRTVRQFMDSHG